MGNQKQKWTPDEEEALLTGVAKHGPGKWKNILKDPEFTLALSNRSNIDLKDKWRNLSVSTGGQGSKEKSRAPKTKSTVASKVLNIQNSNADASIRHNKAVVDDPSNCTQDQKNAQRYNRMIFEALLTMKDVNGSDIGAILSFIEQRHGTPLLPNFRRLLSTRLRRLVLQGKLEKVQNGYKIREETPMGTKTPSPKQKDIRPQLSQNSGSITSTETQPDVTETHRDVADSAAHRVADAENKSFLAAEAVREAERVSKMAEDSESMLELMNEIYKQCSRGELVYLA